MDEEAAMTRTILTAALILCAVPALGYGQAQIRDHIKDELPLWGFKDVDVDGLTAAQVAHINHLLHSNKSTSQIRGNIGAILGDSIFKLFKK